jgi:hypothetical protein
MMMVEGMAADQAVPWQQLMKEYHQEMKKCSHVVGRRLLELLRMYTRLPAEDLQQSLKITHLIESVMLACDVLYVSI